PYVVRGGSDVASHSQGLSCPCDRVYRIGGRGMRQCLIGSWLDVRARAKPRCGLERSRLGRPDTDPSPIERPDRRPDGRPDRPPSGYPVDKDGNIIEDGPGITLVSDGDNIDAGKTQTRTADLTQPGSYLFVCNIPGHFKAGMFRVVTVTPPTAEQAYVPAAL